MDILKARCRTHPVVSGTKRLRSNSFNCLEFAQCTLLIGCDYHIFFACIKRRQAFAKQTRKNRTNSILLTQCLSKPVLNIRLICSVSFRYKQRDQLCIYLNRRITKCKLYRSLSCRINKVQSLSFNVI